MSNNEGAKSAGEAGLVLDAQLAWRTGSLVAADLLLWCGGAAGKVGHLTLLAAHVLLVLAGALLLAPVRRHDQTPWTFGMLLVMITGPLGGVGILILGISSRHGLPGRGVLDAWYNWLSGEERPDSTRCLYEAIVAGRAFRPDTRGPRRFADVIAHGTLAEKQALLGQMGLKYHRDYFPMLALALRSPQSPVRAQAAAVFVKLKEQRRRRMYSDRDVGRAACRRGDAATALKTARSIVDCAESGFLDRSEAREALAEAKALSLAAEPWALAEPERATLLARIVATSGDDGDLLDRLLAAAPAAGAQMRQLLAGCLVAEGRHMELHNLLFSKDQLADSAPAPEAGR